MINERRLPLLHPRAGFVAALALATAWTGCAEPPIDDNEPPPTGVIEGTLQYVGRRVDCDFAGGVPVRVQGHVILTLIDDRNPLPPEGTAVQPVDLLAIGGEDVFTNLATDCRPMDSSDPAYNQIIQRTYSFRWTKIPLGAALSEADLADPAKRLAAEARYRVQGLFDQEGDFNPLFDVQQTPTAGDVAGGAIDNPLAPVPVFTVIAFESVSARPLGQVATGINATLAAVVATDAPIFRVLDGDVSSEAPIPNLYSVPSAYPAIDLTLYDRATALQPDAVPDLGTTLDRLNLGSFVQFANTVSYAWYVDPIDVDHDGNVDCTDPNTDKDCHPVFGALAGNQEWLSPVVLLQRAQNAIETLAGVPTVALAPEAGVESGSNPRVQFPSLRTRVVPFGTLLTNPAAPQCRAIYFANGSAPTPIIGAGMNLPMGTIMECNELPTGRYGVNVLGGLAIQSANAVQPEPDPNVSQTGTVINGGTFASQVWRIPNVFGDARQVGDLPRGQTLPYSNVCLPNGSFTATDTHPNELCLEEQSIAGMVVVQDPNPANRYGLRDASSADAICDPATYMPPANSWVDDPGQSADLFDLCCRPITHLCDVPLCPFEEPVQQAWSNEPSEMAMNLRGQPTSTTRRMVDTGGGVMAEREVPNCLAFPMPSQCCPNPVPAAP